MHQRRLAFTLIELLVVISIIALLIAILLPVLGVARAEAIASSELASGRQLQQAHLSQAYENKGDLLPGAGSSSGAVRNHLGNMVGGAEAQRYPWRIAAHLDGNLEGTLLFNGSERVLDSDETESAINYTVSIAPGYGYNAQYVGGRSGTGPTLAVKDIDRAKHPSNLIAFGSAHRPQIEPTVIGNIVGHEQIFAPTGVNALTSSFAPQAAWDAEYDIDAMGSAHGYIHARHNGSAVFTFLDGHAQRLSPDDVRDMRMWSNQAAIAGDPNWTP